MASNSDLEFIGEVIEVLPAKKYKIRLEEMDVIVEWQMSGKMKLNRITVMEWDYVKVELNEYEMSKGRIVYRYKDPQQALSALNADKESEDSVSSSSVAA